MENPITQLLSRTVKQSGLARVQIVEALGYSNLSKGCRRLDRHLAGEIRDADFMARLAQVLAVPTVQLEVALEATVAQEMKAEDDEMLIFYARVDEGLTKPEDIRENTGMTEAVYHNAVRKLGRKLVKIRSKLGL